MASCSAALLAIGIRYLSRGRYKQWNGLLNGTLDWTTGLSYFPFLDKFLNSFWKPTFFMIYKYLVTMDDCDNDNSCLYCSVFINK